MKPSVCLNPGQSVRVVSGVWLSFLITLASHAQLPICDDLNPGADAVVYALAVQGDQKILVGGSFYTLAGQSCRGIGRLDRAGAQDMNFVQPGSFTYGSEIECVVVQPDGKILLGGYFQATSGTQVRTNLARLNPNGTLDTSFTTQPGGYSYPEVKCLAMQVDGKILVGGSFHTLGGQTRMHLGRLNSNGTLDTGFSPGAVGASSTLDVASLAVQTDGKILVGGAFTNLAGQLRNHIGRLNSDGSLDSGFNPGTTGSFNYGAVLAIAVQPDGKILLGGYFTSLAGQARKYIGRLNIDGSLDTSFNPGLGSLALAASANSLLVQANGKIWVGGNFNSLAGVACTNLGRLTANGTLDTVVNLENEGGSASSYALAGQADGKVLVGGSFTKLAGQPRTNIARLIATEPATQSLTCDGFTITWLRSGTSPEVWRTTFDLSTNNGSTWSSLGAGSRISGGWQLAGLFVPTNANIRARGYLTGGIFNGSAWFVETIVGPILILSQPVNWTNHAGTVARFDLVAGGTPPLGYQWRKGGVSLNEGGQIWGAQTSTLTLSNVMGADAGGYSVVISNTFGSVTSLMAALTVIDPVINTHPLSRTVNAGDTVAFSVAAVGTAPLGYQWRRAGVSLAGARAGSLTLANVQQADAYGYDVVVTNGFGSVTSTVAVLAVNMATADTFNPGVAGASDPSVYSLAVQPDGKILVGGAFDVLGGQARSGIGRLQSDGTLDTSFNPGANSAVSPLGLYSLVVQPDGKIVVGGQFTILGGQPRSRIGRLDGAGTVDLTFNPGVDGLVSSLALQPDGKILLGGQFATVAGWGRTNIARLEGDGTLDTTFSAGASAAVYSLAVQADGKILVGGAFTLLSGQTRNRLGRVNSDGALDATFNPGANGLVSCLAAQADGKILVGGQFTTLAGQTRSRIGRLNSDGTLDTAFNPGADGNVDCLALQTDGKIVVGGQFTTLAGQTRSRIGRLLSNGTLDTNFNPGASSPVSALAVQADGKILAGGAFTNLAGQSRANLARLNNSEPAIQSLTCDASDITWLRSGASPEIWRATFDSSNDGTNWLSLGAGSRITGGWRLTGVSVQPGATVRARGFALGGQYNGSSWFVESTLQVAPPGPIILVKDWAFGFRTNRFGFSVQAIPGQAVVIEASTNLVHWIPIHTNVADSVGLFPFQDAASGPFLRRFYRARVYDGVLPRPLIITTGGSFGFPTHEFSFSLSGIAGQILVIEASTNLVTWTTIATNTLGGAALLFSDSDSKLFNQRFYRAVSP